MYISFIIGQELTLNYGKDFWKNLQNEKISVKITTNSSKKST
jgi:hypothetical protein